MGQNELRVDGVLRSSLSISNARVSLKIGRMDDAPSASCSLPCEDLKGREVKAMRRMLLILVVTGLLVGATAAPAFAFIHAFIPAGQCAASEMAGDNETAEAQLPIVPIQTPPAPDVCPAPQK